MLYPNTINLLVLTTGPLALGLIHRLPNRLLPLDIGLPSWLSLWHFRPWCVRISPLLWLIPCTLPPRIIHIHLVAGVSGLVGAAVLGASWLFEVEILIRLHSPSTVTAVVKRVTMYGTVPNVTCTGTHLLLALRILLPRCITIRELNRMLLCPIYLCESSGIIITPQFTTLGRLPKVVLIVLVVVQPLLWMLLG